MMAVENYQYSIRINPSLLGTSIWFTLQTEMSMAVEERWDTYRSIVPRVRIAR